MDTILAEKNAGFYGHLTRDTRGVMGMYYLYADPQFLQPNADPIGRLVAKALKLIEENGYLVTVGDELLVTAVNGEVQEIFLDGQKLIIG